MFTSPPRPSRLTALALALAALAVPSSAQEVSTAPAPVRDQVETPGNSPEALATAARNILELIETHRFRMRRIDATLTYYRSIGDVDHVRQFQLLREREQNAYQQSLELYRRMLGDQDFARLTTMLRDKLTASGAGEESEGERPDRPDARPEREVSAAERAAQVRRQLESEEADQRQRAAQQVAMERSQAIARARASQRAQLSQRLQQARNTQLDARAAEARRYQPPTQSRPAVGGRPADERSSVPAPAPQSARPAGRPDRP